jgi:hypothetical protein
VEPLTKLPLATDRIEGDGQVPFKYVLQKEWMVSLPEDKFY